jgi:oxygen-independent coproporphyrinogen-3 oxidase
MIGLYIHIPFCLKKCSYCDYISYTGYQEDIFTKYIEALTQEIYSRRSLFLKGISTIYIGGGTPSLLSPSHFDKLFSHIYKLGIPFSRDIEVSIETNPATVSIEKLQSFRKVGINRISIGAQTFDNQLLLTLGRIHSPEDIVLTYQMCKEAGFKNINLDLIFALPGQNIKMWEKDLEKAVSLEPEHFSIYGLQVEENTPLWQEKQKGLLVLPNEDEEADMFIFALQYLSNKGFHRYEVSSFSKKGKECKHNINYWQNGNYVGLGVAAHSHYNGRRSANTSSLKDYLREPSNSIVQDIVGNSRSIKEETIFLGLRMLKGVKKELFKGYEKEVLELLQNGLIEEKKGRYKLTDKGFLLGNRVFEKFV